MCRVEVDPGPMRAGRTSSRVTASFPPRLRATLRRSLLAVSACAQPDESTASISDEAASTESVSATVDPAPEATGEAATEVASGDMPPDAGASTAEPRYKERTVHARLVAIRPEAVPVVPAASSVAIQGTPLASNERSTFDSAESPSRTPKRSNDWAQAGTAQTSVGSVRRAWTEPTRRAAREPFAHHDRRSLLTVQPGPGPRSG